MSVLNLDGESIYPNATRLSRQSAEHIIPKPVSESFTCEYCHRRFKRSNTQEQIDTEMKQSFGAIPPDQQAVVCDDCYQRFVKWYGEMKN